MREKSGKASEDGFVFQCQFSGWWSVSFIYGRNYDLLLLFVFATLAKMITTHTPALKLVCCVAQPLRLYPLLSLLSF